jgi:tetratricopeptide (TPR) repeat protein
MHLPETRIANELRAMGQRFVLTLESATDLPRFGFGDAEKPVLEALRGGTTVAELEARRRELDPRMISAVIYTLATCGACGRGAFASNGLAPFPRPIEDAPSAKVLAPMRLVNQRATTKDGTPAPSSDAPSGPVRVLTKDGVTAPTPRVQTKDGPPPILVTPPPALSLSLPRTMTPQPTSSRTATPIPPLAAGSNPAIKSVTIPPVAVPRTMTPRPAGEPPLQVRTPTKDRMTPEKLDALDAFQRGEMALRREQIDQAIADFARAVDLQPDSADYAAMLAWAKFCAAGDKQAVAAETRRQIDKAITRGTDSVVARMCLGRVERMLGRDKEALRHFQTVLEQQPRHSQAASEARVLEARLRR